ncbi:MAG: hypothetical protein HOP19_29045, partial [Acidobacteria bacterium]|nr:hypothetical protein [Acidobacteriota bacterium]
ADACTVPHFSAPAEFSAGAHPDNFVTQDFNGDGKLDIATTSGFGFDGNTPDVNNVRVLFGDGRGGVSGFVELPTAQSPSGITSGDFNGDGKPDLAVAGFGYSGDGGRPGGISIHLNQGAGQFQPATAVDVGGRFLLSIVAGDFNGDGKLDLAAANNGGLRNRGDYPVVFGDGQGRFSGLRVLGSGDFPYTVVAGDFNGDGKTDLAGSGYPFNTNAYVAVFLQNNGNLVSAAGATVGRFPRRMMTGDFNADAKLDLVFADHTDGKFYFLPGNGAGGFGTSWSYPFKNFLNAGAVADFNQDGKLDVAVSKGNAPGSVVIMSGNGRGEFTEGHTYGGMAGSGHLVAADFNQDMRPDLLVAHIFAHRISYLENLGDGAFKGARIYQADSDAEAAAIGDFTGDGKNDLVVGSVTVGSEKGIVLHPTTAQNSLGAPVFFAVPENIQSLSGMDLNLDGKLDLVVQTEQGTIKVFLNDGNGSLSAPTVFTASLTAGSHHSGDFNGDGRPDLIGVAGREVVLYLARAEGGFGEPQRVTVGTELTDLTLGDFNGDSKPDVAVTDSGLSRGATMGQCYVLLGNGTGGFAPYVGYAVRGRSYGIESSDLTGDGKLDLVVASIPDITSSNYETPSSLVSVLNGNGNGIFAAARERDGGVGLGKVVIADFNRDGKPDVAGTRYYDRVSRDFAVFANDGQGALLAPVSFSVGDSPFRAAVGDLNGDQRPDVAIANRDGAIIFLNAACGGTVANTAPTITAAAALVRQQGSGGTVVTIATVSDAETAVGSLVLTATTVPTGITLNNITNTNGTITANVTAGCNAASGANIVVLAVSDGTATTTANLTVNVTANTPPALGAYPATSIALNGNATITPAAPPSDNGSIASVTVTAPGIVPFLGTATVNATTGVVTVTNARPAGGHPLLVTVTDNCGARTTQTINLTVTCPTITIAPATLPNGSLGAAYNQTLTASGGATPYTFSVMGGALPNGLALSGSGALSGTASASGSFTFTVKATDANGCTATRDYTLVIGSCPAITINPATLPNVTIGVAYNQTLTATGGTSPYSFSLMTGSLPTSLTLNSNGTLSGTVGLGAPSYPPTINFTAKATDANGCSGTRDYIVALGNPTPNLISLNPSSATAGGPGFALLVNGTNFINGASVLWNQSVRSATFINSTQLRVDIPASDIAAAGTAQVTVNNPSPGGGISNELTFTIAPNTTARYEGDVFPRGTGDGRVNSLDVAQMVRFLLRLGSPAPDGEFQRADTAPKASKGDRRITMADVVQVQRYAAGLDPLVETGGPSSLNLQDEPLAETEALALLQAGSLTVTAGNFTRGQIGTVAINANALGSESAVSFTLNYDIAKLSFLDAIKAASLPANLSGAEVFVNDTEPGKVAVVMLLPAGQTLPAGVTTILNLRFLPNGGAGVVNAAFTFTDEIIAREATDAAATTQQPLTTTNGNNAISGNAPAIVSAASFAGGASVTTDSIAAIFGVNMATSVAVSRTVPLPTELAGTTVTLTDSANKQFAVPLFFVSAGQINCLIPAGVAAGATTFTIRNGNGETTTGLLRITEVNPGSFTVAGNGRGLAAAQILRVLADGSIRYENVARFDTATNQYVPVPIDLSNANEPVFLVLYGTGLRGRSDLAEVVATLGGSINAEVLYAGAQGGLAGLDQINLRLPRGLAGRGDVDIALTVDGRAANPVQVNVK